MNYFETFIQVAPDCPAKAAVVPAAKGGKKSIAVLEFELLSRKPYFCTQEELQFEVRLRHKEVSASKLKPRCKEKSVFMQSKVRSISNTPRTRASSNSLPCGVSAYEHMPARYAQQITPVDSAKAAPLIRR